MENAPCLCNFQKRRESGGLRNPQTSAQLSGMDPGPHNGVGPGGVGKAQSSDRSLTDAEMWHVKEHLVRPIPVLIP